MRPVSSLLVIVAIVSVGLEASPAATSRPAVNTHANLRPAASCPAVSGTRLHLAKSSDGLAFENVGDLPFVNASAPALTLLPNGRLLLLFDREVGAAGPTLMVVSQSTDQGRTWSDPQPTRMEGAKTLPGRHGTFVWMPDGMLRLYFVAGGVGGETKGKAQRKAATQPFGQTMVLSAVTRDGLRYQHDRSMGLVFNEGADPHVTAAQAGDRIHLFVDTPIMPAGVRSDAAMHLASKDGRRFERTGEVRPSGARFVGAIVPTDTGFRAYLTGKDGIRSVVSADGSQWKAEAGIRLPGGVDPAVVRLKDGTYLMVYCLRTNESAAGLAVVTSQPVDSMGLGKLGEPPSGGAPVGTVTFEPFAMEPASGEALPGLKSTRGGGGQPTAGEANESVGTEQEVAVDVFPPKPDFMNPVNYLEWLQQQYPADVENNALDAYDAFMPHQRSPYEDRPDFPGEINDMFNSEYSGPIIPWDPAQYPEWEATHNSMQGLLDQFRQATRYERYVCPLQPHPDEASPPDGVRPLYNFLLPSLAVHRAMNKATMADAWRAENGVVDPARMVDAFETCLRSANHMEQGYTLIHHLVGFAHQSLVERNALKALQHNVFTSPEQIESALNTLRQFDHYDASALAWMTSEQALAFDTVQYLYPAGEDGQPRLNNERAAAFARFYNLSFHGISGEELDEAVRAKVDAYSRVTPDEVRQSIETLDSYFRQLREQWRTGYPQVRQKDIEELAVGSRSSNILAQDTTPGLMRCYQQVGRNEAARRATQLSYEVHLFKARNGRWPSSLDELPARPGSNSQIDPFSGGRLGYKMTESGPTIYTVGEDGLDDGGAHSEDFNENGKDYIFWPPQK